MTKKVNRDKQMLFQAALLTCHGNIRRACKLVGIAETTGHDWLKRDEEFKSVRAQIKSEMKAHLIAEGMKRALKCSDNLLMFFLKSLDRKTFDDAMARQLRTEKTGVALPGEAAPVNVIYHSGELPERFRDKDPYVNGHAKEE